MTRCARALGLAIVAVLSSCGDDDAGPGDQPPDDRILTFDANQLRRDASIGRDTGPTFDGSSPVPDGSVPDASPGPLEMGPSTGECILPIGRDSFGPLDPACKPRCSAATAAAYARCTGNLCREDVTAADTSFGTSYTVNDIPVTTPLDCFACFSYSAMYCNSLVCPEEVTRYADDCIFRVDDPACDLALDILNVCLTFPTPEVRAVLDACFASYDGPMGCF